MQAILFDFDGLILDTETPIFTAWQQIYKEHACSLTLDEYAQCLGGSHLDFDPLTDLQAKCGSPISGSEIQPRVAKLYADLIARNEALPGIRETLIAAKKLGLKTALASNSYLEWVEGHLTRLELLPYFDLLRTREDVARLKPEPDLFLAALEGLGVDAREAFVLEDSPNGILAARRAGLFSVAVPNQLTCMLFLNEPDICLSSLSETPLASLLEQIQERRKQNSA